MPKTKKPVVTKPSASQIVRTYLRAVEAGDHETATSLLADGFTMTFPGNVRFSSLQELAEWDATRCRSLEKTFEHFDEIHDGNTVVVYCFGALGGERPDGTGFSGIRFIDRFTLVDGRLSDQKVWNDFGQTRQD